MRKAAFLALLLAGGCTTHLQVQRMNTDVEASRVGAPFPVGFTQYTVEVTREVVECGPELKLKTSAEIKEMKVQRDPNLRFTVRINSLSSPLKVSSLDLGYDANGMITTVNASAEDKTAQVIGNLVGSAAKIATIGALPGASPGAVPEACSKEVRDALAEVEGLRPDVKAATKLVVGRTETLKALQGKAAALGANIDEGTKGRIAKAHDELAAATENLAEKNKKLEKPLNTISHKQTVHWPPHGDLFDDLVAMDDVVWARFGRVDDNVAVRRRFEIFLTLSPIVSGGRNLLKPASVEAGLGLPYRTPEPGRLVVCAERKCVPGGELLAEKTGEVLQLGTIYYLPCVSRPFSNISCSLALNPDGTLKSVGSAQKASIAEGASAALLANLETVRATRETLSSAKVKQIEANTAALKAEADYAAALAANANQATVLETSAVKARVELALAQKAEADALAALELTKATSGVE